MRGEYYWYLLDHGAPPTAAPPPSTHHDGDAGVEEHPLPVPQVSGAVHQRSANNNLFSFNTIPIQLSTVKVILVKGFFLDALHVIVRISFELFGQRSERLSYK